MRLITLIILLFCSQLSADEKKIRQMLEPVVEISSFYHNGSGASGTIIYSDNSNVLILTNYHVVSRFVYNEGEDSETREVVRIKFRSFDANGKQIGENIKAGDIVSLDVERDLAAVWVPDYSTSRVVKLLPENVKVSLFEKTWSVGNPLMAGVTYFTTGEITAIDFKTSESLCGSKAKHYCSNALIYSGSSGGASYIERNGEYYFIGSPRRVHVDPRDDTLLMWMTNIVSIETIREFLEEKRLTFIEMQGEYKIFPAPQQSHRD